MTDRLGQGVGEEVHHLTASSKPKKLVIHSGEVDAAVQWA